MNVLVTGANGQLGSCIRRVVAATKPADHYIFTDVCQLEGVETEILDITSPSDIAAAVKAHNVGCVINCAAYTNVDRAESDPELCQRLNTEAPRLLAEAMTAAGGALIQISTDYVFGADPYNTPCRETQTGTPTGVYGRTKLLGEQAIAAAGCQHIIVRTAWLYSEYGRNFVKTMLQLTATKPQLKVVFDQCGTPTYAGDLAQTLVMLVGRRAWEANGGIYHFSNEGVCSWYDFTKMIATYAQHTACDIQPCHSSEFPSPVVRPAYSVLDKTKIKDTFGIAIPYWTDSLRACLRNMGELA